MWIPQIRHIKNTRKITNKMDKLIPSHPNEGQEELT
jgi:hypothetical protein